MQSKHQKTLEAIFKNPVNGGINWNKIEDLFIALDCREIEGSGSSVTFEKNGIRAYFHRPHPKKEALRYHINAARKFLKDIGVKP